MNDRATQRSMLHVLFRSVIAISFPIAGSIVVIYTLSGRTRTVAIIATVIAIVGHLVHTMLEVKDGRDIEQTV